MTVVLKIAGEETDAAPLETKVSDALRRCLATGEMKPRAEMIRFVVGPDHNVVPDLAEKLPGHGLWVTASHDAVETAAAKNLFAKATKGAAKKTPGLAGITTQLLRRRVCEFLGLAKGAGVAVVGESQTQAALRAGKLALFLHAPDATQTLDNRHGTQECALLSRDEMGAALGYENIVYVGLMPHGLTEKLKLELVRLQGMIGKSENDGRQEA